MTARAGTVALPLLAASYALGLLFMPSAGTALAASCALGACGAALLLRRHRRAALLALSAGFLFGGAFRAGPARPPDPLSCSAALVKHGLPPPTPEAAVPVEAEAVVASPPTVRDGVATVALQVVRLRTAPPSPAAAVGPWAPVTLSVLASGDATALPGPGDRVRVALNLDDPRAIGPGAQARKERLAREEIACTGRILPGRLAIAEPGGGLRAAVEKLRRREADGIVRQLGQGPVAALVTALAVGDCSWISAAQAERFAVSGLAHIYSISGLHLALVVLGAFRILAFLLGRTLLAARVDPRRAAALLCLPLAAGYALLAGSQPPVVRAAVAAALALGAVIASRTPDPAAALGCAALGLLAVEPGAIHEPSFQLSFAAAAGLLLLAPGLRALFPGRASSGEPLRRRALSALFDSLAVTLAATLATLPLTALHFQRASLAALPANVVAAPVGLLTTALAALGSAVALVHEAPAAPLFALAALPAWLLDRLAEWFASWPLASLPVPAPTVVEAAAAWVLAFCLARLATAPRRAVAVAATMLLLLVAPRAIASRPDGLLRIDFLAVGQGDATLLRLPAGGALLVDAGGDSDLKRDVGGRIVVPLLAERGVFALDALAVSHLHPDHVGGVPAVLRRMRVAELWTTGRELEGPFGEPLAVALAEQGVPRRELAAGSAPLELGGIRLEVLGPPRREGLPDDPLLSDNDGSLVLRVVHGEVAILLPGDVEAEGEAALLASGADLSAQLVKAPHHGSATSSSEPFVRRVGAHTVVFCVGRRNRWGFPAKAVEARYEAVGCRKVRTDEGTVAFVSDGKTIWQAP